jgi:hypothetical protein
MISVISPSSSFQTLRAGLQNTLTQVISFCHQDRSAPSSHPHPPSSINRMIYLTVTVEQQTVSSTHDSGMNSEALSLNARINHLSLPLPVVPY